MVSDKIIALVVDDDIKSRYVLEHHLQAIPDIFLLPSAGGVDEAVKTIVERNPNIVFLDVEMPDKSGFDLLTEIRRLEIVPSIIFQTGFDRYAIEAIKYAAFDYLLKPIDDKELHATLARYRNQTSTRKLGKQIGDLLLHLNQHRKIRFNTRTGFIMIDEAEIVYCHADWSYTEIFLPSAKKIIVSMNIGKVEELLNQHTFFRLNRSVIIRRDAIESADRKKRQCTITHDGKQVHFTIPDGQIRKLEQWLGD